MSWARVDAIATPRAIRVDDDELSGTYTYRSFLDNPAPVDDFNTLRFAQLELQLSLQSDGTITGDLASTRAQPWVMVITGTVSASSLTHFRLTGKGRPNTAIADFHYEYDGMVLAHWETKVGQRTTLAGIVLRAADHGSGVDPARAGQTASFLAVK